MISAALGIFFTVMAAYSSSELVRQADGIVHGRVTDISFRQSATKRTFTEVSVEVMAAHKGAFSPSSSVRVIALGGVIGDIESRVLGEAQFTRGQEVFLFLKRIPDRPTPAYRVLGMAQGKFDVLRAGKEPELRWRSDGLEVQGKAPAKTRLLRDVVAEIRAAQGAK